MVFVEQAATAPAPATAQQPAGKPAPDAVFRALRDQGQILREQQENLQNQRNDLQTQYEQTSGSNPARPGIANRISSIDARIADLDKQIAVSDQAIAAAAAVPGAATEPPRPPRDNRPDADMIVGLSFLTLIVFIIPITIAYARRIWRRSAKAEVILPPKLAQQMESLERGMEAIALEVERIGESQRFVTQALSGRAVGAGAAQPVEVRAGERMEQRR